MRLFKWTKNHAVSVPEVDSEHREMFRLAEELRQAVDRNAGQSELQPRLAELLACANRHLAHEERLMKAVSYPAMAWHKKQHDTFRKRVKQFTPPTEALEVEGVRQLLNFLSGWLRDHTALTDRMMGAYVRNYERRSAVLAS